MPLRLAAVAACLFTIALLAAGPPALAQAPANAAAQAECVACKGFEQYLKMIAQSIAALEQALESTSAEMKAITNVLLDEKRPPNAQESADIQRLGDRMKRIDEALDALRQAHSRVAQVLASCNETHCRPAAPPPPPPPPTLVTPGVPVTPVKPAAPADPDGSKVLGDLDDAAEILFEIKVSDDDEARFRKINRETRALCRACDPALSLLEAAMAKKNAAHTEHAEVYGRIRQLRREAKLVEDQVRSERINEELAQQKKRLSELKRKIEDLKAELEYAREDLVTCNLERCGVQVDAVIGVTGTNPFNPDNPAGTPPGPQTPPPGARGTLQFSSSTYSTAEGQGAVTITVTRSGGATGAVGVQYVTKQDSAIAEVDYPSASGTLAWADGDMGAKTFTVAIIDDTLVESTESFSVRLTSPTGGASLGTPALATVSIADNDSPPVQTGSLQFSAPSYATAEGQGAVTITVTRSGGSSGAVSVQYATGQDSAIAGADYQSASGTLAWADGDTGAKSFTVAIIDDTSVESTESFSVRLTAPTGGASLGAPATATVSIADNDSPPVQTGSLQFSSPSYATAEGQGAVMLTVTRTGGSSGAVSVSYITVSGTAGGSDFGGAAAVLSWADGDAAAKSFSITIVDDNLVEGAETFSVSLSAPTGGATIGTPSTATISIADNDTSSGACGPSGNAWQVNSGLYTCFGTCDPCPTPQRLTVDGDRITITPFHAGGAATFTGCFSPVTSDSGTLSYFGQSNHRATLSRGSNTTYSASILSSGGGSCTISCIRIGP